MSDTEQQPLTLVPTEFLQGIMARLEGIEEKLDGVSMAPPKECMTMPEYAEHVGKSLATVRRWRDSGKISTFMEGETEMVRLQG